MNQSDLLILPDEVVKQQQQINQRTRVSQTQKVIIPPGYITVKLDSMGKLEAPSELHFRNYTMDDLLDLTSQINVDSKKALINCLNRMVYEDFDCAKLHDKELEEVMMTIHASFWGNELINVPYYINEDLPIDLINQKENIGRTTLKISELKTKPINSNFKEPIRITIDGKEVCFRLIKIKNVLDVDNFINEKYADQERYFSDFVEQLKENYNIENYNNEINTTNKQLEEKNKILVEDGLPTFPLHEKKPLLDIDKNTLNEYKKYLENKMQEYSKLLVISLIYDPECGEMNLKEKIDYSRKKGVANNAGLDSRYWRSYNSVVKQYSDFGIDSKVSIYIEALKKTEVRRLLFQSLDFIPSLELPSDEPVNVVFG